MRTTRSDNTEWRWYEIHALRVQGLSMPMIARRLELDFKTVRRYLRADSVEQLVAGGVRASKLDPFKPYLHRRLSAGARNAAALHAEIVNRGYTGSYPTLERYVKPLRRSDAATLTHVLRHRPPAVRWLTAYEAEGAAGLARHLPDRSWKSSSVGGNARFDRKVGAASAAAPDGGSAPRP